MSALCQVKDRKKTYLV